jgi:hypothetical protein
MLLLLLLRDDAAAAADRLPGVLLPLLLPLQLPAPSSATCDTGPACSPCATLPALPAAGHSHSRPSMPPDSTQPPGRQQTLVTHLQCTPTQCQGAAIE